MKQETRDLAQDIRSAGVGESIETELRTSERVLARITDGIYRRPDSALRELVANAYDADATTVTIDISSRKKTVIVNDNGSGMTSDEFDFFLRIAGRERSQTRTTESGRVRVGQFGIGFLAMFPFCKSVEIESTVAGSPVAFVARIPASQFCRSTESQDVTEATVRGEEYRDRKLRAKHYTRITLIETTALLHRYLRRQADTTKYRNSIRSFPGMKRLKWELQDILHRALEALPIEYRATLVLREIDGFTYDEIASALGCSVGTVKSRLFRARAQLREVLEHEYSEWYGT